MNCYCNPYCNPVPTQPTTKIESYVKVVQGGMTDEERAKLEGIEPNANNYKLPMATATELGGFKIGQGLEMSEDGVLSVSFVEFGGDGDDPVLDGGGSNDDIPEEAVMFVWDGGGAGGI